MPIEVRYDPRYAWVVATQRKGHKGWDIGKTPMSAVCARAAATQMNRAYRQYHHVAIRLSEAERKRFSK